MEAIKNKLSSNGLPYAQVGFSILNDGIKYGQKILSIQDEASKLDPDGQDWNKCLEDWSNGCDRLHEAILTLRTAAVTQTGQGFDNTTSSSMSDLNGVRLASILNEKQAKVFMMETAMHNAEGNVRRLNQRNQATQAKMINLAHRMKELDHSRATLDDTKKVLAEAINIVSDLQHGFGQLKRVFDIISGHLEIRISNSLTGRRLERSMQNQIRARIIIDTMFQVRGHFFFIYDMSKMYSKISREYLMPCLGHVNDLRIGAVTPADQETAKNHLEEFTNDCSKGISLLTTEELTKFQSELQQRCEEVREEFLQIKCPPAAQISAPERAVIQSAGHKASFQVVAQEEAEIEKFEQKIEYQAVIADECFDD